MQKIKAKLMRLDIYIDRMWRKTVAYFLYYFNDKKDEIDIDWLNMHNDMIKNKDEQSS